ncbi:MAG: hypothetical protein COA64_11555 [Henriciella sp.]|nr:MAG: hypothetical protein COA64_11555 [Henriciella sp.]
MGLASTLKAPQRQYHHDRQGDELTANRCPAERFNAERARKHRHEREKQGYPAETRCQREAGPLAGIKNRMERHRRCHEAGAPQKQHDKPWRAAIVLIQQARQNVGLREGEQGDDGEPEAQKNQAGAQDKTHHTLRVAII